MKFLQSKSEDVEHSKDNNVNRSESNDNGNNGNVNACDNDNEVSCAKNGEIKDQAQVTKVKMALFNKKNNKQFKFFHFVLLFILQIFPI